MRRRALFSSVQRHHRGPFSQKGKFSPNNAIRARKHQGIGLITFHQLNKGFRNIAVPGDVRDQGGILDRCSRGIFKLGITLRTL
jgi:hypothetical protein